MYEHMKNICGKCMDESYIKSYILSNGLMGICSYCNKRKKVVDLDDIKEIVQGAINFFYDDPVNGLGIIDGEYVQGNGAIYDTWELLDNELGLGGCNALEDIVNRLPDHQWCNKEFYGMDDSEEKIYTWESFVNQVKYKTRYFFVQEKVEQRWYMPYKKPFDILAYFARSIEQFNMIDTLRNGDIIFRARQNRDKETFQSPEDLGPPPAWGCLKPNRMSPAGIPMFYGSSTKETCLSEMRNKKGKYTIGKWTPVKDLRILNLTSHFIFDTDTCQYYYPDFPSIFDQQRREDIFDYQFILKFASDLSGKVENKIASIEYVPTQIVAEYLRKVALFDKKHLDGICYYSSIDGGINYALFIEQEECTEQERWRYHGQKLKLLSVEETVTTEI